MMDYREDFDKVHRKLENIDHKLDDHLSRISKAETHITWLRGHIRMATMLLLTIISGLILTYIKFNGV